MHDSTIITIVKKYYNSEWLKGEQLQKNKERHARGHEIY